MAVEDGFAAVARKAEALHKDLSGGALRKITSDVAFEAKKDVFQEVESDIGADRRLSNWGRFRFGAGYELTSDTTAVLTPRPAGPWRVLQFGRLGKEDRYPKRRGLKYKRYRTPWGVRSASRSNRWKSGKTSGWQTFSKAARTIRNKTPERIDKHTKRVIGRHFGRR